MATSCTCGPIMVACDGVLVGYQSATSIFSLGELCSVCRRKSAKVSAAMAVLAVVAIAAMASVAIPASAALTLYFIAFSGDLKGSGRRDEGQRFARQLRNRRADRVDSVA